MATALLCASLACSAGATDPRIPVAAPAGPGNPATNVPDALTRTSGLRLTALSRPAQIYARNCQGCHGEAGVSVPEIPTLAGRVGYYTRVPQGRAYLVQVPNVAMNPSADEDIAGLLNWLLNRFSRDQLPEDFAPYTAAEVARLRRERVDVRALRAQVIRGLISAGQLPAAESLRRPGSDPR